VQPQQKIDDIKDIPEDNDDTDEGACLIQTIMSWLLCLYYLEQEKKRPIVVEENESDEGVYF